MADRKPRKNSLSSDLLQLSQEQRELLRELQDTHFFPPLMSLLAQIEDSYARQVLSSRYGEPLTIKKAAYDGVVGFNSYLKKYLSKLKEKQLS